jgi:hypothetical protein
MCRPALAWPDRCSKLDQVEWAGGRRPPQAEHREWPVTERLTMGNLQKDRIASDPGPHGWLCRRGETACWTQRQFQFRNLSDDPHLTLRLDGILEPQQRVDRAPLP